MYRSIQIAVTCLLLHACAAGSTNKAMVTEGPTACEDPRPQVCTMDYTPVCATLQDDTVKTYSNGCGACADINVKSWVANACPE